MFTPSVKRKREDEHLWTVPMSDSKPQLTRNISLQEIAKLGRIFQSDNYHPSITPSIRLFWNGDIAFFEEEGDSCKLCYWLDSFSTQPIKAHITMNGAQSHMFSRCDVFPRSTSRELLTCSGEGELSIFSIRTDGFVSELIRHRLDLEADETVTCTLHAG